MYVPQYSACDSEYRARVCVCVCVCVCVFAGLEDHTVVLCLKFRKSPKMKLLIAALIVAFSGVDGALRHKAEKTLTSTGAFVIVHCLEPCVARLL